MIFAPVWQSMNRRWEALSAIYILRDPKVPNKKKKDIENGGHDCYGGATSTHASK
jgi:hypothetical protein